MHKILDTFGKLSAEVPPPPFTDEFKEGNTEEESVQYQKLISYSQVRIFKCGYLREAYKGSHQKSLVVFPLKKGRVKNFFLSISCLCLVCLVYVLSMTCLVYVLSMSCLCLVYVLSMSCLCLVYILSMSCLPLSKGLVAS